MVNEEVGEGHRHNQRMLGGGEVIFYLHNLGGIEGARVAVEECDVSSGSTDAVLDIIDPDAILVVGVVGGVGGLRHCSVRDEILTCVYLNATQ